MARLPDVGRVSLPARLTDIRPAEYSNAPAPLPEEEPLEHDLPAQADMEDNHSHVPMPVITDVSERDPKKDRSLNAPTNMDSVGTKPISSDPAIDPQAAKADEEAQLGGTGSTGTAATGSLPTGTPVAKPHSMSANLDAPPPASKTQASTISEIAATTSPGASIDPPPPAATGLTSTAGLDSGISQTPSNAVSASTAPTTVMPGTPGKVSSPAVPASPTSTFGGTPAKPAPLHTKQTSGGSDMKKTKSSFFGKVSPSRLTGFLCRH